MAFDIRLNEIQRIPKKMEWFDPTPKPIIYLGDYVSYNEKGKVEKFRYPSDPNNIIGVAAEDVYNKNEFFSVTTLRSPSVVTVRMCE